MRLISNLQRWLYKRQLKRQLQSRPHAAIREAVNLESAASVGILFDATQLPDRKAVQALADRLQRQSKQVKLLGYLDNKGDTAGFSFPTYNQKNLSWAQVPTGDAVQDFLDHKFDLLLVLYPQAVGHMEYITALTYAHLKLGPSTPNTYCFDLMIDAGRKTTTAKFIEQVEQLLKKTNVREAEPTPV